MTRILAGSLALTIIALTTPDSGNVFVDHQGSIVSHGDNSYGIYAQSVAGGGGVSVGHTHMRMPIRPPTPAAQISQYGNRDVVSSSCTACGIVNAIFKR